MSASCGTETAALCMTGGQDPPTLANVEQWNGSSWSQITVVNTARDNPGGAGITTAALCFGGSIPPTTGVTEDWNGSAWTEVGDLANARGSGRRFRNFNISSICWRFKPHGCVSRRI